MGNIELTKKINDWKKMSESIKKMYLKLIKIEQAGTITQEYQDIVALLPNALRYEREKIDALGINISNYHDILITTDLDDDEADEIANGDKDDLDLLRRNIMFEDIILKEHHNFLSQNNLSQAHELMLTYEIIGRVAHNVVTLIDYEMKKNLPKELLDYLIYLKYVSINTNSLLEKAFVNNGCHTLPAISLNTLFPHIEGYNYEAVKEICESSFTDSIKDDLETLLDIENSDMKKFLNFYYRVLLTNKARLVLLHDPEYTKQIEEYLETFYIRESEYTETNRLVESMIKEAHRIVLTDKLYFKKI